MSEKDKTTVTTHGWVDDGKRDDGDMVVETNEWRQMTEHKFPWKYRDIVVAACDRLEPEEPPILLRCNVAEHGAIFRKGGGMLSIHEEDFIPFAWKIDDTPDRNDESWPPLLTDYLTEAQDCH